MIYKAIMGGNFESKLKGEVAYIYELHASGLTARRDNEMKNTNSKPIQNLEKID